MDIEKYEENQDQEPNEIKTESEEDNENSDETIGSLDDDKKEEEEQDITTAENGHEQTETKVKKSKRGRIKGFFFSLLFLLLMAASSGTVYYSLNILKENNILKEKIILTSAELKNLNSRQQELKKKLARFQERMEEVNVENSNSISLAYQNINNFKKNFNNIEAGIDDKIFSIINSVMLERKMEQSIVAQLPGNEQIADESIKADDVKSDESPKEMKTIEKYPSGQTTPSTTSVSVIRVPKIFPVIKKSPLDKKVIEKIVDSRITNYLDELETRKKNLTAYKKEEKIKYKIKRNKKVIFAIENTAKQVIEWIVISASSLKEFAVENWN